MHFSIFFEEQNINNKVLTLTLKREHLCIMHLYHFIINIFTFSGTMQMGFKCQKELSTCQLSQLETCPKCCPNYVYYLHYWKDGPIYGRFGGQCNFQSIQKIPLIKNFSSRFLALQLLVFVMIWIIVERIMLFNQKSNLPQPFYIRLLQWNIIILINA